MASTSYQAFETAIADAERLLVLFDNLPKTEQQTNEVLKRGDAVHQGRNNADPKVPHLVKRDEVEKVIKFFKELVKVTDGVAL